MSNSITLTLDTSKSTVHINNNGIMKDKDITLDQLLKCLKTSLYKSEKHDFTCSELLLSANNKDDKFVGVKSGNNGKDNIYVIFRNMENKKIDVNYCGITFKNIKVPNIVFALSTVSGIHTSSYICCTFDNVLTEKSELYRFPFPNVMSTTNICWGANGNDINKHCTAQDVSRYLSIFLFMEFTDHCFDLNNKSKMPVRKYLTYLQNGGELKKEWLVELSTFKNWFKNLK